jgi:hypothetical protein
MDGASSIRMVIVVHRHGARVPNKYALTHSLREWSWLRQLLASLYCIGVTSNPLPQVSSARPVMAQEP